MKMAFTIAHVEDHPMLRKLLGIHFFREGIGAGLEASNGVELLEKLDSGSAVPDVCLLDLNMPIMDGFETARHLRARYPSVKILAYSGNDVPQRVEEVLGCGAHGFISKDLAPEEIHKALLAVLNNQPYIKHHPVTIKGSGGRVAMYPPVQGSQAQ